MSILEDCSFCHGWHKTLEEAQVCEKVYKVLEKDYSIGAYPFRKYDGGIKEGILFYVNTNEGRYTYIMEDISWYAWLKGEKDLYEVVKDLATYVKNNLALIEE